LLLLYSWLLNKDYGQNYIFKWWNTCVRKHFFGFLAIHEFTSKVIVLGKFIKKPITSNFLLPHLILRNTQSTFSKKCFAFHKMKFFYNFWKTFNLQAFWSTIHTSLPQFEVSGDVGSGTHDLGSDLSDWKKWEIASELSIFCWKCRKGTLPLFVTHDICIYIH